VRLIIERYLYREILASFFAVSLLLVVMFFSTTFFQILTKAMEGELPVTILFSFFALKLAENIVVILPFAFFLAVLLALGRLYKDNEITALTACGAGPGRLFSGVATMALLVALFIAALSLYFAPWVGNHAAELQEQAKAKQEIEGIVPGRFNSFGAGRPTIYAERYDSKTRHIYGVFVQLNEKGGMTLLSAASAYERKEADGSRYLVLQDGYRYEGVVGRRDYRIVHFAEHGIRIQEREVRSAERHKKEVATSELWHSGRPEDVAELHWRLAMPLSTLLLALMAVPMSKTSPRRGRYAGLFLGVVLYMVYNNLLIVGRSALNKGDVPPLVGLWWVHLLILALLGVVVWRQQRVKGPSATKGGKS
jgi:lipopolysaccharide export system permease protein